MREDHHLEAQTPKKDQSHSNRKPKPASKKQQKSVKKSLNSAFAPITEDDVLSDKISLISEPVDEDLLSFDIGKVSFNSDEVVEVLDESLISEALGVNEDQSSESVESFIGSLNQLISPLPATPSPVSSRFSSTSPAESTPLSCITTTEVTPLSSQISADSVTICVPSYNGTISPSPSPATPSPLSSRFASTSPVVSTPLSCIATTEMTPLSSPITADSVTIRVPSYNGAITDEMNSLKVEEMVKNLRASMFQVLHSADIEPWSKKVLDALVKMVIEEFYSLHEERNIVVELFSKKIRIVLLIFVLGMLAVSAGLFVFSNVQGYGHGPRPT